MVCLFNISLLQRSFRLRPNRRNPLCRNLPYRSPGRRKSFRPNQGNRQQLPSLQINGLLGSFTCFLGAFGSFHFLSGNDFRKLDEEAALSHIIEYIEKFLLLVFNQFAQLGLFHHPTVHFRIVIHFFQRNFFLFLPVIIANEERSHLVVSVACRL